LSDSGKCTSGTQQIRLSNADRPQRARDARALRERARTFRDEHEDRLSFLAGHQSEIAQWLANRDRGDD